MTASPDECSHRRLSSERVVASNSCHRSSATV
jgi:hypothetical protein